MLNPLFSSSSSRRSQPRQRLPSSPSAPEGGPSDVSSVSQSTVGPLRAPGNFTSASDGRLDEVRARINDTSVYAPTPSLIHSIEKDGGTLRTSDVPTSLLDPITYQRDNAQITKHTRASEKVLFTPQDAIVAQVFGKPIPSTHGTPPPPSAAPPSASLQMTSDSLPPVPSTQTPPSTRARLGPTLSIYEPFSGAKLGECVPVSPSTATPGLSTPAPPPTSDDSKLWSSLERILGLQAEIAVMHAEMESVGGKGLGNIYVGGGNVGGSEGGNVGPRKRSTRRGQTLPVGDEEPEEHEPSVTTGGVSEISVTDHSDGGNEDEDDEDEDNIHGNGKRRRDEEFSRLAEQFAQRKASIGKIMNKLDDLSTALKMFHTLPAPLFDSATPHARTADTMSFVPSNVSATSSPLLPHTSPRRVTTPPGSRTPPIPPISTLAPPTTSGDPSGQPSLELLITPILPRTALPTIIPGVPHVESPSDMDAPQSSLYGVPRGR